MTSSKDSYIEELVDKLAHGIIERKCKTTKPTTYDSQFINMLKAKKPQKIGIQQCIPKATITSLPSRYKSNTPRHQAVQAWQPNVKQNKHFSKRKLKNEATNHLAKLRIRLVLENEKMQTERQKEELTRNVMATKKTLKAERERVRVEADRLEQVQRGIERDSKYEVELESPNLRVNPERPGRWKSPKFPRRFKAEKTEKLEHVEADLEELSEAVQRTQETVRRMEQDIKRIIAKQTSSASEQDIVPVDSRKVENVQQEVANVMERMKAKLVMEQASQFQREEILRTVVDLKRAKGNLLEILNKMQKHEPSTVPSDANLVKIMEMTEIHNGNDLKKDPQKGAVKETNDRMLDMIRTLVVSETAKREKFENERLEFERQKAEMIQNDTATKKTLEADRERLRVEGDRLEQMQRVLDRDREHSKLRQQVTMDTRETEHRMKQDIERIIAQQTLSENIASNGSLLIDSPKQENVQREVFEEMERMISKLETALSAKSESLDVESHHLADSKEFSEELQRARSTLQRVEFPLEYNSLADCAVGLGLHGRRKRK